MIRFILRIVAEGSFSQPLSRFHCILQVNNVVVIYELFSQEKPLTERLIAYREHISNFKNDMDTHEEVLESLKQQQQQQQQTIQIPSEAKQTIRSQIKNIEDKQRAIAILLLQYCQGLKILESTPDSGSEKDD